LSEPVEPVEPAEPDEPAKAEVDELDEFELAARKRRRRSLVIVAAIVAVVVGLLIWRRVTGLPGLDHETEKAVREALPEIEKLSIDVRRAFAAEALVELEPERLPPGLVQAFDDYAGAPPGYSGLVLLRAFTDDAATREAWQLACPAGLDAIADGVAKGPKATFMRCGLEREGLVGAEEASRVSLGELVACHAAWAWLGAGHAQTELERRLFRMLMLG